MRKHQGPLTSGFVRKVDTPGRFGDGRGGYGLSLLVRITATGYLSKTYQQRLYVDRKPVMTGLGNTRQLTLTEARAKAKSNHRAVEKGDPTPRRWSNMKPIFKQVAETYIGMHAPSWKNSEKDQRAWRTSLEKYAYPMFGNMAIDRIKPRHVLDAVGPPLAHEKRDHEKVTTARHGYLRPCPRRRPYRFQPRCTCRRCVAKERRQGRTPSVSESLERRGGVAGYQRRRGTR